MESGEGIGTVVGKRGSQYYQYYWPSSGGFGSESNFRLEITSNRRNSLKKAGKATELIPDFYSPGLGARRCRVPVWCKWNIQD